MAKKTKDSNLSLEERLEQALIPNWDEPYKLPDNWCWTKLESIANWGSGGTPSRKNPEYYIGDIPWVKTGELNNSYIYETEEHISEKAVSNSSAKLFPINTVVIAMYGATIGKVGILGIEATTNQACACGVCSSAVDYKYLFYYAISQRDDFISKGKGGAQPNISQEIIKQHEIPLPPLAEQRRIISYIESLFSKLDEAKEKAQEVVDGFETRKAAILHKAFSGELTAKWKLAHSEICEIWKQKKFSMITHNFDSQRIPLSQAERNNLARTYDYYGASGIIDKVDRFLFEGRKLLIGEDGANLITRSKPIAFIADGQYWVNNHAHVITTTSEMLLDFLCYYINSIDLTPYVTGSAQPKMTQAKMNSIPVPVPSIQEQTEIVRLLDDIICKEQYAKEAAEAVVEQIDTMKKAILARAFRGELGTNDPSEESAVELLKSVLMGNTNQQEPQKSSKKSISIPNHIEAALLTKLEKKIISLFYATESKVVSVDEIMSVSSKKIDIIDTLIKLEQRGILIRLNNSCYRIKE